MKKELFIICIVGMFLASGLLGASSVNTVKMNNMVSDGDNHYDEVKTSAVGYSNEAYFGELWSVNRDKSFGVADLSEGKDVYADWVAEENEASGYLTMTFANFIANDPGETISNYCLSTYRVTVHDGPSTSDPVLFTDEKEVLENAGDMIGDLIFPVTVETEGQPSRDLAVVRTSQTQVVSNAFRVPIQSDEGLNSETDSFHISFNGFESNEKTMRSSTSSEAPSPTNNIEIDLGSIEIYTELGQPNRPIIRMRDFIREYTFDVNISEDVDVTAWVNYTIDLASVPHPIEFLKILGCKANFLFEGGYQYDTSTRSACSEHEIVLLTEFNLQKEGTLECSFTVNTGETNKILFMIACDLTLTPIAFWDIPIPGDSADSETSIIYFQYV